MGLWMECRSGLHAGECYLLGVFMLRGRRGSSRSRRALASSCVSGMVPAPRVLARAYEMNHMRVGGHRGGIVCMSRGGSVLARAALFVKHDGGCLRNQSSEAHCCLAGALVHLTVASHPTQATYVWPTRVGPPSLHAPARGCVCCAGRYSASDAHLVTGGQLQGRYGSVGLQRMYSQELRTHAQAKKG